MIQYLLKNADFTGLSSFISPNFFKVVSPKLSFQIATQILRNRADKAQWERVKGEVALAIERSGLDVSLFSSSSDTTPTGPSQTPRDLGHLTLKIFFLQILSQKTWLTDLRTAAFQNTSRSVIWAPSSIYYSANPQFLLAVRSLYRGFYTCDDSLFDRALTQLNLMPAKASLRAHFGTGDQTHVKFRLKEFQDTFTKVFEACAQEKRQLPGDFFVLGMMLVSLYERLESLDTELDVRSCFDWAAQREGLL